MYTDEECRELYESGECWEKYIAEFKETFVRGM